MNLVIILTITLVSVNAVRVSPKLDFGESDSKPVSAGIRPSFGTNYQTGRSPYRREDTNTAKSDNIEVVCVSGNCNTTKVESEGGISADVVVHIKTNIDTPKNKSHTVVEAVPDVPIVVGTKTSTTSTIDGNRRIDSVGSNYPAFNNLSPIPSTNGFVPSIPIPTFFQNTGLRSDSQLRGFNGNSNYAPSFQDNINKIDYQTTSYGPSYNTNNNGAVPSSTWYPRRGGSGTGGYNPVEFRKTYSNAWTPIQWTRSNNPSNHERRNVGIPRWTPCVCQNHDGHDGHNYPTTPSYPPPNQPAGINGKLGSLI